jgi:uncharacterized DUF497 family protein
MTIHFLTPDYEHSNEEDRVIAIGRTPIGRPVFIVFTLRMLNGRELVRPLSARFMHLKEIKKYDRYRRQKGPEV